MTYIPTPEHKAANAAAQLARQAQLEFGWSPTRIEALKALYKQGLSCSQIAKQLRGVTRNAVISKINRLGLNSGGRAPSTPRTPTRMGRPAKPAPISLKPVPAPARGAKIDPFNARSVPLGQRPPERSPEIDSAPLGEPKTLLELGRRDCRWPLSKTFDEATADTLFCGQRVALREGEPTSWCSHHRSIALVPLKPMRPLTKREAA